MKSDKVGGKVEASLGKQSYLRTWSFGCPFLMFWFSWFLGVFMYAKILYYELTTIYNKRLIFLISWEKLVYISWLQILMNYLEPIVLWL